LTIYFSQGSVATDLRGGDNFNYIFLRRSFLNITVKNYENWSNNNKILPFGARGPVIMTHRVIRRICDEYCETLNTSTNVQPISQSISGRITYCRKVS